MRAWLLNWVELNATVAFVSWDLSVSSGREVITSFCAVLCLNVHNLVISDLFLDGNTFAIAVLDEVNVTFIILLCAKTGDSHDLSFEVLAIEALRVLLSSDICNLLAEVAFVWMTIVSVIVVRAPEFKVRFLSSWVVNTLAFWLMKSREI